MSKNTITHIEKGGTYRRDSAVWNYHYIFYSNTARHYRTPRNIDLSQYISTYSTKYQSTGGHTYWLGNHKRKKLTDAQTRLLLALFNVAYYTYDRKNQEATRKKLAQYGYIKKYGGHTVLTSDGMKLAAKISNKQEAEQLAFNNTPEEIARKAAAEQAQINFQALEDSYRVRYGAEHPTATFKLNPFNDRLVVNYGAWVTIKRHDHWDLSIVDYRLNIFEVVTG